MTALAILLGIAFVLSVFAATSYRNECLQWRQHNDAAYDLYEHCLQLERYNAYLEERLRMTSHIYAGGMMVAGWVNVDEKMQQEML